MQFRQKSDCLNEGAILLTTTFNLMVKMNNNPGDVDDMINTMDVLKNYYAQCNFLDTI